MCSRGWITHDGNEIEKRDQGKEQTETGRDSNPPAKKKKYSLESHAFSVSYKSFADTSAFFSISFRLLSLHSPSCMSMESRERKHGRTRTKFDQELLKRWWSMFSRYVVKIQDLVPRRILFHFDHKIRKHNIITILSLRSSKYTLRRKGSIEVRRFIYRIMRSFYSIYVILFILLKSICFYMHSLSKVWGWFFNVFERRRKYSTNSKITI